MRVALVSEHANPLAALGGVDAGGQNVHVGALAAHLAARGHDVTVYSRRDDPDVPTRVVTPEGYAVEHVPAGPAYAVGKDDLLRHMPAFARYLEQRWREQPVDVAHAHFWMSGVASTRAARRVPVPVVQTFHALGTVKRRQQGARDTSPPERIGFERRLCRQVDHVIATCRDEVAELRAMGLPPSRASVVPCGVDTSVFRPAEAGRRDRPRLLSIGRLVERKGIGNVIEALAALPGVELVVAGGPARDRLDADPEVQRLRDLAVRHGVADRVRFEGSVSRADVPALMSCADIVVAVPWYEPFGIVPVEAMACGRPVVGSAVGGLLDTVVPGVTGELVPPRRPDLLAPVLGALLADPVRRHAYGLAGRARAVERYQWAEVAAQTEAVYAAVAAPGAASEAVR
ncbi:MAG TPA: glycosyltransferase [Intrasporangium sp.]|uniref:glycosyltransferase n=1 Tax=Intrasporangium sp. TaxID=1925024 RepID=UPI002D76DFB1|nr:glycosyltransferase [Intrasporangium sp.]HET7399672.1 glycosyltransferase [Intrasporangium sp.]